MQTILKKRLGDAGRGWLQQLPIVLWARLTTAKYYTRLSPFHLAFKYEVVLPTEVMVLSTRIRCIEEELNDQALQNQKVLINKMRL